MTGPTHIASPTVALIKPSPWATLPFMPVLPLYLPHGPQESFRIVKAAT